MRALAAWARSPPQSPPARAGTWPRSCSPARRRRPPRTKGSTEPPKGAVRKPMLTPEEADFVSRDPAIPGLKTVLDPLAFLEALGRVAPARDLRLARIQYVKYKPGTFCRVAYRVDVAGAPCELEARACRPEDLTSRRRKKTLEAAVPGLLGSGSMELGESSVLVTVFPNDSSLPQVPLLADPEGRFRLVRDVLPDRPEFREGD